MISESRLGKTMQFLPVLRRTLTFGSLRHLARSWATQRVPCWDLLRRESCLHSHGNHRRNLKPELPSQALLKVLCKKPWQVTNNSCHFKPFSFRAVGYMATANENNLQIQRLKSQMLWQIKGLLFPQRVLTHESMEILTRELPLLKSENGLQSICGKQMRRSLSKTHSEEILRAILKWWTVGWGPGL